MSFLGSEEERFNPRLGPGTRHAPALPTGPDGRLRVTVCLSVPGGFFPCALKPGVCSPYAVLWVGLCPPKVSSGGPDPRTCARDLL